MTNLEETLDSILASADFTVASYLNVALEDEKNDLSQRMAELALQLQLQTQSCHEDIGRIGAELQAILPRCNADIGRVGTGLEGLKMDATSLLESIQVDTENEVSSSLETLSTLHALQANLNRTKDILTAAATWDTTLHSIAPLLAEHNLAEAVQALATLENGEKALRGMPHPEEREVAIDQVRQQVSSLLQPQLKHALANMSTRLGPLQQCVALYSQLHKMDTLKTEYIKNRPTHIHKSWFDFKPPIENNDGKEFLEWLPGWFDAVHTLVSEERRQALSIFGPDLVPEILLKILRECFRPVLGSFQSRLESICPIQGESKGTLETICTIYEATLNFLSVVYESVSETLIDMLESGAVKGNGALYYYEISAIFTQIASPFGPFQKNLPTVEGMHLNFFLEKTRTSIQQTLESTTSIESLQQTVDALESITTQMIPVAESALARFELLKAGFGAMESLQVIDTMISNYAKALSNAVKSLSASLMGNRDEVATSFEDSHVVAALHVLRVGGLFRQNLSTLEDKARGRFQVLSERLKTQQSLDHLLSEGAKKSSSTSGVSVLLPDSMSPVGVDSLIAAGVFGERKDEIVATAHKVLLRLLGETGSGSLFSKSLVTVEELCHSSQSFVFDLCYAIPKYHLKKMPSMSIWREASSSDDYSYGALPQQYITYVGEHLLALVQALEPFAEDKESLEMVKETMSNLREVSINEWRDLSIACGVMATDSLIKNLLDPDRMGLFLSDTVKSDGDDPEYEEDQDPSVTEFCNPWLDAVGISVAGGLLESVLKIPSLSPKGVEQLKADLNYLINVFSALGLKGHPHPLLVHVTSVLGGNDNYSRPDGIDVPSTVENTIRAIEERLSAMMT